MHYKIFIDRIDYNMNNENYYIPMFTAKLP